MAGVDQLFRARRHVGQDAQPTEGIGSLERLAIGDGRAADAVETVAARDEVAGQLVLGIALPITELRPIRLDVVKRYVRGLPDDRSVSGKSRGNEVARDLGLAIDRDGLPRQLPEIDVDAPAAHADLDALVDQPVAMQPLGDTRLFQQLDRALLQHAGADAGFDIAARPQFENHALDAVHLQQARQQEPRRTGADDADLCTFSRRHARSSPDRGS
jgi:hypothetical protein